VEVCSQARSGFPRDTCLHELFEAQVERTPGLRVTVPPSLLPQLDLADPDEVGSGNLELCA
jgi:non-ribosomal peptide synthetase component F